MTLESLLVYISFPRAYVCLPHTQIGPNANASDPEQIRGSSRKPDMLWGHKATFSTSVFITLSAFSGQFWFLVLDCQPLFGFGLAYGS